MVRRRLPSSACCLLLLALVSQLHLSPASAASSPLPTPSLRHCLPRSGATPFSRRPADDDDDDDDDSDSDSDRLPPFPTVPPPSSSPRSSRYSLTPSSYGDPDSRFEVEGDTGFLVDEEEAPAPDSLGGVDAGNPPSLPSRSSVGVGGGSNGNGKSFQSSSSNSDATPSPPRSRYSRTPSYPPMPPSSNFFSDGGGPGVGASLAKPSSVPQSATRYTPVIVPSSSSPSSSPSLLSSSSRGSSSSSPSNSLPSSSQPITPRMVQILVTDLGYSRTEALSLKPAVAETVIKRSLPRSQIPTIPPMWLRPDYVPRSFSVRYVSSLCRRMYPRRLSRLVRTVVRRLLSLVLRPALKLLPLLLLLLAAKKVGALVGAPSRFPALALLASGSAKRGGKGIGWGRAPAAGSDVLSVIQSAVVKAPAAAGGVGRDVFVGRQNDEEADGGAAGRGASRGGYDLAMLEEAANDRRGMDDGDADETWIDRIVGGVLRSLEAVFGGGGYF